MMPHYMLKFLTYNTTPNLLTVHNTAYNEKKLSNLIPYTPNPHSSLLKYLYTSRSMMCRPERWPGVLASLLWTLTKMERLLPKIWWRSWIFASRPRSLFVYIRYIPIHVYMYIYTCTYIHSIHTNIRYIHTYIHTIQYNTIQYNTYTYIHTYIHTYTYVYTYIYISHLYGKILCICVYMCVCAQLHVVYMFYMYIHTYTYIHDTHTIV